LKEIRRKKSPALTPVVVKNKKKFKTDKVEKVTMSLLEKTAVMRITSTRTEPQGKWKCVKALTYLTLVTWMKKKIRKMASTLSRYNTMLTTITNSKSLALDRNNEIRPCPKKTKGSLIPSKCIKHNSILHRSNNQKLTPNPSL
jgi:hypothetical protein